LIFSSSAVAVAVVDCMKALLTVSQVEHVPAVKD